MQEDIKHEGLDFTDLAFAVQTSDFEYLAEVVTKGRKYDKTDVLRYLTNPSTYERQLREVSIYNITTSTIYMRTILYLANLLTYDHLILPRNFREMRDEKDKFADKHYEVAKYLDGYNIKHEWSTISLICLLEDVFFGIERRDDSKSVTIQRLPTNYCKIFGIVDGIFKFAFNMRYFLGHEERLELYPSEFKSMYAEYESTGKHWQEVDPRKAVCFKFRSDVFYPVPPFASMFVDLIDYEELKEINKQGQLAENFKLIIQKVPWKKDPKHEKDMLINESTIKSFQRALRSLSPEFCGVITTPLDIDVVSLERRRNESKLQIDSALEDVYNGFGVNSGLFNTNNKTISSINMGVSVDEMMMFPLLRQYERFFNYRLKMKWKNKYQFKCVFPDLTHSNRGEVLDRYLKTAQFGYSKMYVAACMGLSPLEFVSASLFERDILEMQDLLVPLSSSHTSAQDNGAPEKEVEDLTDSGEATRDRGLNEK